MEIGPDGGDRIEDDEWPLTEHKPPPCPQCGRPSVPIVYGFPSPGLMDAAERGAVVLGGCVIEADQPTHERQARPRVPGSEVLMLRPTESPTLFLQQLGRGLRRAPGKGRLVPRRIGDRRQDGSRRQPSLHPQRGSVGTACRAQTSFAPA